MAEMQSIRSEENAVRKPYIIVHYAMSDKHNGPPIGRGLLQTLSYTPNCDTYKSLIGFLRLGWAILAPTPNFGPIDVEDERHGC